MAGKAGYIATVQIVIQDKEVDCESAASDYINSMLFNTPGIFDWSFLQIGSQYLYPQEVCIPDNFDFEEGGFLEKIR